MKKRNNKKIYFFLCKSKRDLIKEVELLNGEVCFLENQLNNAINEIQRASSGRS